MFAMNVRLKEVLARAENWSEQDQKELMEIALEIEVRRRGPYRASAEELKAIDEGLAAIERGDIVNFEEVDALLAKYRSA
jgi:predicted transcriptional regulator